MRCQAISNDPQWYPSARSIILLAYLLRGSMVAAGPFSSLMQGFTLWSPTPLPGPVVPRRAMDIQWSAPGPIRSCSGTEDQYVACRTENCNTNNNGCEPLDCRLGAWTEWHSFGSCTGLATRHRTVATPNNECGRPCTGVQAQTAHRKTHNSSSCELPDRDCEWSPWSEWPSCEENAAGDQSTRSRGIHKHAIGNGRGCIGNGKETKTCAVGNASPVSCQLTEWGEWTECSPSCGGGWRGRMRRIQRNAKYGGEPCKGDLKVFEQCGTQPCGAHAACELSAWSDWIGCTKQTGRQVFRSRRILRGPAPGAEPCIAALKETEGCSLLEGQPAVTDCSFGEWSSWSRCSMNCGGGQQERSRSLLLMEKDCRVLQSDYLKQVTPCNVQACDSADQCKLSAWTDWDDCSQDCGGGVTTRTRHVQQTASGGDTCVAALGEVKACIRRLCDSQDCLWGEWDSWGACSRSCGGGEKRRSRSVLQPPRHEGMLCPPESKAETASCNTQSCEECVDGKWTDWEEWSQCTTTCGPGYHWRHRSIAQRHNFCGKPATGLEEQYEECKNSLPCEHDQDCKLSDWENWGACSRSCSGVMERHRQVKQHAKLRGKPCINATLQEFSPCNPSEGDDIPSGCRKEGPDDCQFGQWAAWADCSATCGGGQKTRARDVLSPSLPGGNPCNGKRVELGACNTQHCDKGTCIDCLWGQWSDWDACSKCGDPRSRERRIERMANHCGRKCESGYGKELGNCTTDCEHEPKAYCVWTAWADTGGCSATCGTATKMQRRELVLLVQKPAQSKEPFLVGRKDMVCSGEQARWEKCMTRTCNFLCEPEDCEFGSWSAWGVPACSERLCARERLIAKSSRCGGTPCAGATVVTKKCDEICGGKVDCALGSWDEWQGCNQAQNSKTRVRAILQPAENGGRQCHGDLLQVSPCLPAEMPKKADCAFGPWTGFTLCSKLCNGGVHQRTRALDPPASFGGKPCDGPMHEIELCNTHPCKHEESRSCILGEWDEWSDCGDSNLQMRVREIAQQPLSGGATCAGSLDEIRSCSSGTDCKVTQWTPWDECDKSCGVGQRQRHRQVVKNPHDATRKCPHNLVESEGCHMNPCPNKVNCEMSPWADWRPCSASCGMGNHARQRLVAKKRTSDGLGCLGDLEETRPCVAKACACKTCLWGDWQDWSQCSRHCGGGQRTRERKVVRFPEKGCPPCEGRDTTFIEPCNTVECPFSCIDGHWGQWQDWEACSTTCKGGITWRSRSVWRKANSCGRGPYGVSHEKRNCLEDIPCKPDQDCEFDAWSTWSGCSASCAGIKTRSRTIASHGYGSGRYCIGPTRETSACASSITDAVADFSKPELYMTFDKVSHNNLGGHGPDKNTPHTIRYSKAATSGLRSLDLVVRSTSVYEPADAGLNGDFQGKFGNVNLLPGTVSTLEFQFMDSGTDTPALVEDLAFKFFDLDTGYTNVTDKAEHEITIQTKCEEFYTSYPTSVQVDGACTEKESLTLRRAAIIDPTCGRDRTTDLNLGKLNHTNLAGRGPNGGPHNLRFEDVTYVDGMPIDLVISVREGSEYRPQNPSANGAWGQFGIIAQVPGHETSFVARFVESGTETPVRIPKVNFTFFDIDHPSFRLRERVAVYGYTRWFAPGPEGRSKLSHQRVTDGMLFTSTQVSVPEPNDTHKLSQAQQEDTVITYFEDVSEIRFDLAVMLRHALPAGMHPQGQAFMFAGTTCSPRITMQRPVWDSKRTLRRLQVGRRLTTASSCPPGYYRTASIVFQCEGGSGSVHLVLPRRTRAPVQELPAAVDGLKVTLMTGYNISLDLWDPLSSTYVVHAKSGVINNEHRNGVYEHTLHVKYSGLDEQPPILESITLSGKSPGVLELQIDNKAKMSTNATLTFEYAGVTPCPKVPEGCAKFDGLAAKRVVRDWSSGMCRIFPEAKQAWEALAELVSSRGIRWEEWAVVWNYKPTWKLAFAFLDINSDGYVSFIEFKAQYKCPEAVTRPVSLTPREPGLSESLPSNCLGNGGVGLNLKDVSPLKLTESKERRAATVRFKRIAKVNLTLQADAKTCGHNFLFAGKVCIAGSCDPCSAPLSCRFLVWNEWTPCSRHCGSGHRKRSRDVVRVARDLEGEAGCNGALEQLQTCNVFPCKSDCMAVACRWYEWSSWSKCSDCTGQRKRTRDIAAEPKCGGAPCRPENSTEIEPCYRTCGHTAQYCVWAGWSTFGECSAKCGCGRKKRSRKLHVVDQPPEQAFEKKFRDQHLQSPQTRGFETQHFTMLLAAFVGGSVTVIAVLAAGRAFPGARHLRQADARQQRSVLE